jgi:lipopolysaccharide/colanic/teichoic acid biosynthesis glycosyltransferase
MMGKALVRGEVPDAKELRASPPLSGGGKPTPGTVGVHGDTCGRFQDLGAWARRVLNITVASLFLILATPLLMLAAIAVKLSSPGPVIYSQKRVGLERRRRNGDLRSWGQGETDRRELDAGGKVFRMHKFRTMYANGNGDGEKQVWARKDDPRITPVGRVLRAFRLDEFPQMVNVLLGDMNIVGPRPEQPEIFRKLRREITDYPRRQHVLPGITGLAQVNHRYDRCLEDVERKLSLDLHYIERNSPSEDLKIMLKTIPVILFRRGVL